MLVEFNVQKEVAEKALGALHVHIEKRSLLIKAIRNTLEKFVAHMYTMNYAFDWYGKGKFLGLRD